MDPKTVQNWSKLINLLQLVMRIEITREILSPWLSDFLKNSSIHFLRFFIFGNKFPESHGFVAICRSPAVSKMHVQMYPLIIEGWRNCMSLWPSKQKTVDFRKHLPNIKTFENGYSNFLENMRVVPIKLLEFALPNQSIYINFVRCLWFCCHVDILKL